MEKEELIHEAFLALNHSYSPYSNYPVGAAILMKDGSIVHGTNIENASYPAGICAEHSALVSAYSRGYRKSDLKAMAVVSKGRTIAGPCGICRQMLAEMAEKDMPIILANESETIETTIRQLLPMAFEAEDMQ